jgi:adenylate cyclase
MAKETERKFLITGDFRQFAIREIRIIQAYLSIDPNKTVRIRLADNEAFITIKSRINGKTISRNEWEFPIPYPDAYEMMKLCLPGRIVKTRHLVPFANHTFEVDVFHDKNEGLIIAELELNYENEPFEKPDWLGEEVTGDPSYYNANLIK